MPSICPVATALNRHQRSIDSAAACDEFIERQSEQHEKGLLNHGVTLFDVTPYRSIAATIETDVECHMVDVISAAEFDVLANEAVFALCRTLNAAHCLPEQINADIETLTKFAAVGLQAIRVAAKEIAAKEWKVLHD